jgi:hypothetical protein
MLDADVRTSEALVYVGHLPPQVLAVLTGGLDRST